MRSEEPPSPFARFVVAASGPLAALVAWLPFAGGPARAEELVFLPGGTAMTIVINAPGPGVQLNPGVVQITGRAEIAHLGPVKDTTVAFILDRSGSMTGDSQTDCDGDGDVDTRFDCVRMAVRAANRAAASTSATVALTGLGMFSECALPYMAFDVDLSPPQTFEPPQLVAPPGTDGDGDGTIDLEEGLFNTPPVGFTCIARAINTGGFILQSPYNQSSKHVVVVISDGIDNETENSGIIYFYPLNTIVRAFAVPGARCDSPYGLVIGRFNLDEVAGATGTCVELERWKDLEAAITQAVAPMMLDIDVEIDGVGAVLLSVQPALPRVAPATVAYNAFYNLGPGPHEICARAKGRDLGGEGSVRECITVAVKTPTSLTYDGATTQANHGQAGLSATLAGPAGGAAIPGKTVAFVLGSQSCAGVTDAAGRASCTLVLDQTPGEYAVVATFGGDAFHGPSIASVPFLITRGQSQLDYTGPTLIANRRPALLSADLREPGPTLPALAGRSITFSLGSGPASQNCTGTTDATGRASCLIDPVDQPLGPGSVAAAFGGDSHYLPSSASVGALVFAYLQEGAFVVGDVSVSEGGRLNWWGSQWAENNALSGGTAPSAFKGFANVTAEPPTCGVDWASRPGNSCDPPTAVPSYMAVMVSSAIGRTGSALSGDSSQVVIVNTEAGYRPNPGHPGHGTSVAVLCDVRPHAPLTIATSLLAPGSLGHAYSHPVAASGGLPPYVWSSSEGVLPLGLTLDAGTGLITGSPGREGTFAFTVQVKDEGWRIDRKRLSITVSDPARNLPRPLYTLPPCRAVDTREAAPPGSGPLLAGHDRTFVLAGVCGVPASAKAVSVNITVTEPTDAGDLRVFPAGTELPLVSSVNYSPGHTRANNAVLALGAGGAITMRCDQAKGSVHLLIDVNGYFQ